MRVLVTGSTGFVGSHLVRHLLDGPHDVNLLVRSPSRAEALFGPPGPRLRVIAGDVTNRATVVDSLDGCDAVIHAAGLVSLKRRDRDEVHRVNTVAAETVLGEAVHRGIDPVIFVSSAAVFRLDVDDPIGVDTPLRLSSSAYSRSKVEAERYARGLQDAGAPVVTVYPGGVFGPDAPALTLMHDAAVTWTATMPIMPSGVNQVDVRDVATLLAALLEPRRTRTRYMAGGHFFGWRDMADAIEEMTGIPLRRMVAPGPMLRGMGRFADFTHVPVPGTFPLTEEAMTEATRGVPIDSAATIAEFGPFRDRWSTLRDGLAWMAANGHIEPERAGALLRR